MFVCDNVAFCFQPPQFLRTKPAIGSVMAWTPVFEQLRLLDVARMEREVTSMILVWIYNCTFFLQLCMHALQVESFPAFSTAHIVCQESSSTSRSRACMTSSQKSLRQLPHQALHRGRLGWRKCKLAGFLVRVSIA